MLLPLGLFGRKPICEVIFPVSLLEKRREKKWGDAATMWLFYPQESPNLVPMLLKTRGIVFRTLKYGETSLIVEIFTEERGLRKYLISGVRTQRPGSRASLFQALSIIDLVVYEREDRDLNRIKEVRAAIVYQAIPFDVRKGAIALFLAEISRRTIREATPNAELFSFLLENLRFLDLTGAGVGNLHLHFMLQLSGYLGFMPAGDCETKTPCFHLREGMFVGPAGEDALLLSPVFSQYLYRLLQMPLDSIHELHLTREERFQLLGHLIDYYRMHLDHFPEINSHQILREIF